MIRTTKFAALAALTVLAVACADGPLQVSNIQLGRSLNPDNSIASPTTLFKRSETVYVSALTSAAGSSTIGVKWMYGTRVIDEPTKAASFKGPGATEFHLQNSGGFPPGDYSVEVFVDGISAGMRNFKVDDR